MIDLSMFRWIFPFLTLLFSCSDAEESQTPQEQFDKDIGLIKNYLKDNNIDAQNTSEGLFYVIHSKGSGKNPDKNSIITVKYEGKFLINDQIFDSNNQGVTFPLSNLIIGWQIGIPLISEGGSITLYIPSYYAYGKNGSQSIPPNSVLYFNIQLLEIS